MASAHSQSGGSESASGSQLEISTQKDKSHRKR